MTKYSILLSFLVTALVAFHTATAFAPQPVFHRPTTTALDVKISVSVGDGEPIESALRRFKREVNESGHLMDLKHKRFFETTQEKVKRKIKEGRLRRKFERMNRKRMSNRV